MFLRREKEAGGRPKSYDCLTMRYYYYYYYYYYMGKGTRKCATNETAI